MTEDSTPAPSIRIAQIRKSQVGELRPSQVLISFGIGSLVDLPNLSVLVMGLEDWPITNSTEIGEERLRASVQKVLGGQVKRLLTPPRGPESIGAQTNWFDESNTIGVPVAPFPRWLVCSKCRLLAPIGSGLFEAKATAFRPDKTRYLHNCTTMGTPPTAVPARFLVACNGGHLDDFPWMWFVHRGDTECKGPLTLYEIGASGEAADVEVQCKDCGKKRRMAEAFGRDNALNTLTQHEQEILRHLQAIFGMKPNGVLLRTSGQFVIDYGWFYKPKPTPKGLEKGSPSVGVVRSGFRRRS